MKVALVATHAHPLPSPAFTGDSAVLLDLCWSLRELGHDVTLLAPDGTTCPDATVLTLAPRKNETAEDWERAIGELHWDAITQCDIVHDFSIGKTIAKQCDKDGAPFISTLLGGNAYTPLRNTVVWSEAMRGRVLRGATDYEGTTNPNKGGAPCPPFTDVKVAWGGCDLDFYSPGERRDDHYLWLYRWHEDRGYRRAIEWAKETGHELWMVGASPEYDHHDQAGCAVDAMRLAWGLPNVRFEWLPPGLVRHHEVKRNHYRRAKAMIQTVEFHEPFGLSMIEALACGTPVIPIGQSATLGSVPELLGDGIENPRERAKRLYGRDTMARQYVELYQQVLDGKGWGA